MGLRMRKSFRLAKGVRLNIGKKSASISVGNKYGHTTVSTGSSRRRRSNSHLKEDLVEMVRNQNNVTEKQKASNRIFLKVCGIIMVIVAVGFLFMAIPCFTFSVFGGVLFSIPTVIAFLIGRFLINASKH